MKKVIRLTESDLARIVKRVLMETEADPMTDFNKCFSDNGVKLDDMPLCRKLLEELTNPDTKDFPDTGPCMSEVSSKGGSIWEMSSKVLNIGLCLSNTFNKSQNPTKS